MILQNAEQLGLQFQRNFADLVQKESAFIRQLKAPNLLTYSPGECALFVSEQLTFQQASWNRGTIQGDKPSIFTFAGAMDGASNEAFAGSSFSQQKNCRIAGRNHSHSIQHFSEGKAFPNDSLKVRLGRRFPCQVAFFQLQPAAELFDLAGDPRIL
jgi:hypothetical protein